MRFEITESDIITAKERFKSKTTGDGKHGPFYNGEQLWSFDITNGHLFFNYYYLLLKTP